MSDATHVLLAVTAVGALSLALRLVPLLGARLLPDRIAQLAGWAGLAVLAAITVRAVVNHRDASLPGALADAAPLLAAAALGVVLALAYRGRSLLLAVGAGAGTYLVLGAALAAL
jgi:branched-subunit amino acid transport protein